MLTIRTKLLIISAVFFPHLSGGTHKSGQGVMSLLMKYRSSMKQHTLCYLCVFLKCLCWFKKIMTSFSLRNIFFIEESATNKTVLWALWVNGELIRIKKFWDCQMKEYEKTIKLNMQHLGSMINNNRYESYNNRRSLKWGTLRHNNCKRLPTYRVSRFFSCINSGLNLILIIGSLYISIWLP